MKEKEKIQSIFAKNLTKALQKNNWSAADLARASGVSMATLSRILSGKTNPSLVQVTKISQALNVSINSLLSHGLSPIEGEEKPKKKDPKAAELVTVVYRVSSPLHTLKDTATLLENAARGSWVECWSHGFVDPQSPQPKAHKARQQEDYFEIEIQFPLTWFEKGSVTSLLSVISAPLTSTYATIEEINIPPSLKNTYPTANLGIKGLRDKMEVYGRPFLSATMRPMAGISPKIYGQMAYEALKGGVDFTCDPSLMHSLPEHDWKQRCWYVFDGVNAAMNYTESPKDHAFNITANTLEEMHTRIDYVTELGGRMVMVDTAVVGLPILASLAQKCKEDDIALLAMGGRALQRGTISETVQTTLLAHTGVDAISTASPLNGDAKNRRHICQLASLMNNFNQPQPIFPACGGGHNPWHFPRLIEALGNDIIIQCGGSVMAHPWGSSAGAKACRVATEATVKAHIENLNLTIDGRSILQRAATGSPELETALRHWKGTSFLFGVVQGKAPLSAHVEVDKDDR